MTTYTITSGETAAHVLLVGDLEIVSSGGVASGTIVNGGDETVLGITIGTTLNDGGRETVSSGGVASSTTVNSGGFAVVDNGGTTSGTTVNASGSEVVDSGALTIDTIVNGGDETVLGITIGTTLNAGGKETVSSGGVASSTSVNSGGFAIVDDGGTTSGMTVNANGSELVDDGGQALGTIVNDGGQENIVGVASGTIVNGGGQENVDGVSIGTTVKGDGVEFISSGGEAINATVNSGGIEIIAFGGLASGTTVNSGNENIDEGGVASSTILNGGQETVLGITNGTIVNDGGREIVSSGGLARGITVNSGGLLDDGGQALVTMVNGGQENVEGVTSGTTVNGDGIEFISSGGQANSAIVNSGGSDIIASGGLASFTTINNGGVELVDDGGLASGSTVNSGGVQTLASGGIAIDTHVLVGGSIDVVYLTYDAADSAGIAPDGLLTVTSAGTEVYSQQLAGDYTGTHFDAARDASGDLLLTETEDSTTPPGRHLSEWEFLSSLAVGTIIDNGGAEFVQSGGVASGATVNSGGAQVVQSGGQALGTIISYGGQENIDSGGVASGATVSNGGQENIYAGGVASGATVNNGGQEAIIGYDGLALALGTIVNAGGEEDVYYTNGVASGTTVNNGGAEVIYSGGTASGTIVNGGGREIVQPGGVASGVTVSSGGVQILTSGAIASNTHVLAGGSIDVYYLTYDAADSATITASGLLTVTSNGATVYSQQLAGDYIGDHFDAAPDASGSLLLTENDTPCYCPGTLIVTDRGEVPVEALQNGDRVINCKSEPRAIKWIGKRSYAGRFIMGRRDILPICFEAGCIGETASGEPLPRRDLWVSPHHAMYLNGVLIEAKDLVNGISIYQADGAEDLQYFHIELDSHDVIIAEGVLAESFIDDNGRGMFHNAGDYAALYPNEDQAELRRYYAPRVDCGPEVEEARAALDARARRGFGVVLSKPAA